MHLDCSILLNANAPALIDSLLLHLRDNRWTFRKSYTVFRPDVLDSGMGCMEARHLGATNCRQPCHTSKLDSAKRLRKSTRTIRAQKHQLTGRDITSLKLHELCWQGWNNLALRSLAQVRYASILFARSIKEATFMSFLMQKFRESKADLDQFAQVYCDQQGLTVDSSLSESAQKSAKMKHFCESIYNLVTSYLCTYPAVKQPGRAS